MSTPPDSATPLLTARLSPHRSLTQAQAHWLLAGVGTLSAALSLPFLVIGAWPVVGFLGLDVLLLAWAFRASFRAARAYELVTVSVFELLVTKFDQNGHARAWRMHPWWTRLAREEDEEFGLQRLQLISRQASVEVAACLDPAGRADFADTLSLAMARARAGTAFS